MRTRRPQKWAAGLFLQRCRNGVTLLRPKLVSKTTSLLACVLLTTACASTASDIVEESSPPTTSTPTSVPIETTSVPIETTSAPIETTSVPVVDSREAVFASYEFPTGLLAGSSQPQPSQLQGVLGVPEGPGPFPVAIILHGSHPICFDDFNRENQSFSPRVVTEEVPELCGSNGPYVRADIGLSYIAESLVDHGFAALSIDVFAAYIWWGGEVDEPAVFDELISVHYGALEQLNEGDDLGIELPSLEGRLDLGSVSLIGHSRGGGAVLRQLQPERQIPFEPASVVLVQPLAPDEASEGIDVPVLLIRGGCDEDVGPDAGLGFLTTLTGGANADMFIPGAGHRMLNAGYQGSTCDGELDPALAQSQTAAAISSFLASDGSRIDRVVESESVVEWLGTGEGEVVDVEGKPQSTTSLQMLRSETELIEPLAPDADYSAVLDEDF